MGLRAYDDGGHSYSSYRIVLSVTGRQRWQKTLRAPEIEASRYVHVLLLSISTRTLPQKDFYELEISGESRRGWQPLGQKITAEKVMLNMVDLTMS